MDNFKTQTAFAYETFKQMENKKVLEQQEIEMLETTYSIKIVRK